jgi:3-oxoadipate enol-lactonase/4-carboxymuconolactone decarboxylase
MLTHTPVEGYTGTCAALRDADLTAHVPTIRTRTLVLCGAEDVSTPPDQARELTNGLPNAHFQLIEGAGHLPCIEQPERTGESIVQFLRENRGDKYEAGMRVRREVLGDAHVERAAADQTELDADFQRFITETAWGSVWARPGLDRQMRHLLTIVILAALGKEDELALHLRATQNTGVTPEQIKEALLHVAVYAGIPAANTAFRIAKQVYAERRIANDEET